jgi:hypothetical protein
MDRSISPPNNPLAELLVAVLRKLRVAHERIQDLETDLAIYRDMAIAGIHALHHVTAERDRFRRNNQRLHEERRGQDKTREQAA